MKLIIVTITPVQFRPNTKINYFLKNALSDQLFTECKQQSIKFQIEIKETVDKSLKIQINVQIYKVKIH